VGKTLKNTENVRGLFVHRDDEPCAPSPFFRRRRFTVTNVNPSSSASSRWLVPYCLEPGVWYQVRQGIRGLWARDERDVPRVFLLCEPSSHYYKVMTRGDWMPCLLGEVL
jgi:hypothetical protein